MTALPLTVPFLGLVEQSFPITTNQQAPSHLNLHTNYKHEIDHKNIQKCVSKRHYQKNVFIFYGHATSKYFHICVHARVGICSSILRRSHMKFLYNPLIFTLSVPYIKIDKNICMRIKVFSATF